MKVQVLKWSYSSIHLFGINDMMARFDVYMFGLIFVLIKYLIRKNYFHSKFDIAGMVSLSFHSFFFFHFKNMGLAESRRQNFYLMLARFSELLSIRSSIRPLELKSNSSLRVPLQFKNGFFSM